MVQFKQRLLPLYEDTRKNSVLKESAIIDVLDSSKAYNETVPLGKICTTRVKRTGVDSIVYSVVESSAHSTLS